MAVTNPVKVKGANITTPAQAVSFGGGLDERGDYNIAPDAISYGLNAMVNSSNNATHRLVKRKWLPSSVGMNGEVAKVYYNSKMHYFIADDGKVKYITDDDDDWIDCGGSNSINTDEGVFTTFMRINDQLHCMNGEEIRFIDLATLDMVQYTFVANPVGVLTCTATGISGSGAFNVYYGVTYNSDGGGETAVGPIKTQAVSKSRTTWSSTGSEYLTIAFNDTPPAGATSRNIYAAIALQGTTPVASDLAMLKANIPIADTSFVDNGSIGFDISYNTAPDTNSTAGIKATNGVIVGNTPVLYGDPDNPYTLYFGAITEDGVSFGSNNGAQRLPLLQGTNYYPTSVVGFRNNQNVPNLLALFSSTDGTSKQQIISMKTLTYGNTTINYWGADELNIGASSVYSRYGVVAYLGKLIFPSSDGIVSISTEENLQNVLMPSIVSNPISKTYSTIKNADFSKIVADAWNNLIMISVPSRGFSYNNQLLVYDQTNKNKPKWYIWDLAVDWLGAVSPPDKDSFMYIRQGNEFFKLVEGYVAEDQNSDGTMTAFPVTIRGALLSPSTGKNRYFALAQSVLYLAEYIGTVTIKISYVTQKGRPKSKSKTFTRGSTTRNFFSGWGNPSLLFNSYNNRMINWSTPMPFVGDSTTKDTKRARVKIPNVVTNEVKFEISSYLPNTSFELVNGVNEGVNIGELGDIV